MTAQEQQTRTDAVNRVLMNDYGLELADLPDLFNLEITAPLDAALSTFFEPERIPES